MGEMIFNFDSSILLFFQEHLRADWLNPIVNFITRLGDAGIIWILLGIAMMFFKKTRREGFVMLLCLLGAWLINDFVLKPLIARPRPFTVIPELVNLVGEDSYSFPSGHTNASFACALALTLIYGKKGVWSYLLAGLIAVSRCYVGVHYPTDIFGGMIVGTLASLCVFKLAAPRILKKAPAASEEPSGEDKEPESEPEPDEQSTAE